MRDPYPVIVLVPGVGLLSFAKDKATARIASEFYVNAINVMRGAESVSAYVPIPEQEAFDIEYWLLEEAKLQRMPKPKSLEGRIALVTGGAGGIGGATAKRLLAEGACVVITDIDEAALEEAKAALSKEHGRDRVRAFRCDVTDEASVRGSYAYALRELGGSTSSSRTPGSPRRPPSRRRRSRCGAGTWASSRPATSWCRATPSRS